MFKGLLRQYGIDPDRYDITFIPASGELNAKFPYALASKLKIPFLCILDRDVFQNYLKDKRKDSLGADGFPQFKETLKANTFWIGLFSDDEREEILQLLCQDKYSNFYAAISKKNILPMHYSLEVDLVENEFTREKLFKVLKVPSNQKSTEALLIQRGKRIKNIEVMAKALNGVPRRNLPASYRKILHDIEMMVKRR